MFASYKVSKNSVTSLRLGMESAAPFFVTESEANAQANFMASIRFSPLARREASAPLNASPAPVVSTAFTLGA